MNLGSHSRRQPTGALIRYNNIVNKQIFINNGQTVTHKNTDYLNIQNVNQRNINRASPTVEKKTRIKG